ncbi:MFS transporter [Peribacillus cavernae]|uniref:Putative proline/betaine transporter n=1 Tax=Peribacillus cavernae TaxID=1674310 RepID=A0A3S0TXM5_9BACI|nr:MFS transporter [Peribacillus cavernae]MDQ0219566.1 metabolite-proton symporter [Peribacillus cavernae]RUQ27027.1 MFS transporter [Peribacillus cavernae]
MSKKEKLDAKSKKVLLASLMGSAIEFYDFFLYGTVAALVFNKLFFPNDDPFVSLLLAYASFGVTFFVRPLGGLIFSHMGDKFGRKNTLVISLLLMGISTVCIGLLPTYSTIGIWAPILLVAFRIIQGIGLGGEWGGAILLAVESAPKDRKGFFGSFPAMGIPLGMLLGTFAVSLASLLPDQQFLAWGWRIPFVLSAVLVVIGIWIRSGISETSAFKEEKEKGNVVKVPLFETLRYHWKAVLISLGAKCVEVGPFYLFTTFFISYATDTIGYSRTTALNVITVATLVTTICIPLMGILSDKIGRKRVFLMGALALTIFSFPYFYLLSLQSTIWLFAASIIGLGIMWSAIAGLIGTMFSEMFSTNVGYTGITLGYQTGSALFGGTAPMIATLLLSKYNNSWVPLASFLAILCIASLISVLFLRENKEIETSTVSLSQKEAVIK